MDDDALPFLITYLLLLLTVIILTALTIWLNQKEQILENRRLLLILLVGILVLALPGLFGWVGLQFTPVFYVGVQLLSLLLGGLFLHLIVLDTGPVFGGQSRFVTVLASSIAGWGWVLFTPLFNYLSSLRYDLFPYNLWAATSILPFVLPTLFAYSFNALVTIPDEINKLWYYPRQSKEVVLDSTDYYHFMLLEVQIHKNPTRRGEPPINVKARTTGDVAFGTWFQKFIDDYNYKFPNDPIRVADDAAQEYGWLFYSLKPSWFRLRLYIDFEQTITRNKLRENYLIIAKRVEEVY